MDQNDIQRYLASILRDEESLNSEEMTVFGKLIRITIGYRDKLKAERDEVLTVEDTKKALEIYEKALKDNQIPDGVNHKIDGLVRLWLKNISGIFF